VHTAFCRVSPHLLLFLVLVPRGCSHNYDDVRFPKVEPILDEIRAAHEPHFAIHFEKLIDATPDGRKRTAGAREQMKAIRDQLAKKQAKIAQQGWYRACIRWRLGPMTVRAVPGGWSLIRSNAFDRHKTSLHGRALTITLYRHKKCYLSFWPG
jgi:hypothetical protein